jgi:hypothetical protein
MCVFCLPSSATFACWPDLDSTAPCDPRKKKSELLQRIKVIKEHQKRNAQLDQILSEPTESGR